MRLLIYLREKSESQLIKWANTFAKNHDGITPDDKGWFDVCVTHMKDNIDDPEAYCAKVRDEYKGSTFWRGKGKSKKQVEKDVKANQNKK